MTPIWKLEKVKALNDEVRELHPVLRELFHNLPTISAVNYTQGSREFGADFVLTKRDEMLMEEDYVGVIVKSVPIKQNHDEIRRQIRECEIPRVIEGGKKNIHITEIWVITSKEITKNAQETLHHEYKNTKIRFFDADKLVGLIDRHYPRYWEFTSIKLNKYIADQKEKLERAEGQHSLVPSRVGRIDIPHQIISSPLYSRRKFKTTKYKPSTLTNELAKQKFLIIEGGMGSGKSEMLRETAISLCNQNVIEEHKIIPYFTTYRDILDSGKGLVRLHEEIEEQLEDKGKTIAFFIDGLDETDESIEEKTEKICALASELCNKENAKVVMTTRPIQQEKCLEKIGKHYDIYSVCPLSYGLIINIVEKLCGANSITNKFRDDLQRSPLMKALPRTPLSAILLGRLLAENIKELPSTLPELYSKYTELVLGRWDLNKGNGSEKEYETIHRITGKIAAYMSENDLEYLGLRELKGIFNEYLEQRRTGQKVDDLMRAFLCRQEIIGVDIDRDAVFFKHKTFKEFFFASMLYQQKGIEAPINKPFDIYWQGTEYFYLGIIRDAPKRISELSSIIPQDDIEILSKASSMGSFLLAAYQTPYVEIEKSVSREFIELAQLFIDVSYKKKDSWLNQLPELQLLCLITFILRQAYSYDFFLPALQESKFQVEIDECLDTELKNTSIFLFDTVLASLGDKHAFVSLTDKRESTLSWTIRFGITKAAQDVDLINTATKKMEKRISKATKGNRPFINYIEQVQEVPIAERKNLTN